MGSSFLTSDRWSTVSSSPIASNNISDVSSYKQYAWAVYRGGFIVRSDDYGKNWQKINLAYSDYYNKILALDTNKIWIVGRNNLLLSTDTGLNWERVDSVPGGYEYEDIDFIDRNNGCLLVSKNYQSEIYCSLDGGRNWKKLEYDLPGYFNSIELTKDNYLFAFGDNGKILATNKLPFVYTTTSPVNDINAFRLLQNYPNPFNPSTKIEYSILQSENVTIKIYNVLGRQIKTFVNEEKPAGDYIVEFNGNNLPSGVYFYQIQAGNFIETKKMLLIK